MKNWLYWKVYFKAFFNKNSNYNYVTKSFCHRCTTLPINNTFWKKPIFYPSSWQRKQSRFIHISISGLFSFLSCLQHQFATGHYIEGNMSSVHTSRDARISYIYACLVINGSSRNFGNNVYSFSADERWSCCRCRCRCEALLMDHQLENMSHVPACPISLFSST